MDMCAGVDTLVQAKCHHCVLNAKVPSSWTSSTCTLKSPNLKFLCVVSKIKVRWSIMSLINMELVILPFGGGQYMPVIHSELLFTWTFHVMCSNVLF